MSAITETSTFTAWVDALDALEHELDVALDPGRASTWTAPRGLDPMPVELVERAQRILLAQRALSANLDGERSETARHLAAIRTVPSATSTGASVYLDVAG